MFIAILGHLCCQLCIRSSTFMHKTHCTRTHCQSSKYEYIIVCLKMSLILLRSLEDEKGPSYAFQLMTYHYIVKFECVR